MEMKQLHIKLLNLNKHIFLILKLFCNNFNNLRKDSLLYIHL